MGLSVGDVVFYRLIARIEAPKNYTMLSLLSKQSIGIPHIYPMPLIPAIGTQIYFAAEATHRVRSVALHVPKVPLLLCVHVMLPNVITILTSHMRQSLDRTMEIPIQMM